MRDLGQLLQQPHLDRRGEVVGVHQLAGRLLHRFGDLGMAVAQAGDIDAGGEVDVDVAVHVGQRAALARLEGDREEAHLRRIALHILGRAGVHLLRFRPRRRRHQMRHGADVDLGPILVVHRIASFAIRG